MDVLMLRFSSFWPSDVWWGEESWSSLPLVCLHLSGAAPGGQSVMVAMHSVIFSRSPLSLLCKCSPCQTSLYRAWLLLLPISIYLQCSLSPAVNFSIANESSRLIVGFWSVSSLYFVYQCGSVSYQPSLYRVWLLLPMSNYLQCSLTPVVNFQ